MHGIDYTPPLHPGRFWLKRMLRVSINKMGPHPLPSTPRAWFPRRAQRVKRFSVFT